MATLLVAPVLVARLGATVMAICCPKRGQRGANWGPRQGALLFALALAALLAGLVGAIGGAAAYLGATLSHWLRARPYLERKFGADAPFAVLAAIAFVPLVVVRLVEAIAGFCLRGRRPDRPTLREDIAEWSWDLASLLALALVAYSLLVLPVAILLWSGVIARVTVATLAALSAAWLLYRRWIASFEPGCRVQVMTGEDKGERGTVVKGASEPPRLSVTVDIEGQPKHFDLAVVRKVTRLGLPGTVRERRAEATKDEGSEDACPR